MKNRNRDILGYTIRMINLLCMKKKAHNQTYADQSIRS